MSNNLNLSSIEESQRLDIVFCILFSILILITRIPFMSKFLYEWDSVNYALSFIKFDISNQQPHPPGYIFYVGLGKIVNIIFNDPNTSLIVISIIFSILTVMIIYFLGKEMFNQKIAVVSAFLLIFNPLFWFYGEIATIYPSQSLFASVIALTSYKVIKKNEKFVYISAILLGIAGGFRQDMIIFMFPLWLFSLFYSYRNDLFKLFKAFLVLALSILTWYLPTVFFTGGFEKYHSLTSGQFVGLFKNYTVLLGGPLANHLNMINSLIWWSLEGMGIIGFITLCVFVFFHFKEIIKFATFKNLKLIFFALWILPAFIFYFAIFIAKPGYTLLYLPAFSLIVGYIIVNLCSDLNKIFRKIPIRYFIFFLILFYVLLSSLQFIVPEEDGINYHSIKKVDAQYVDAIELIKSSQEVSNETVLYVENWNLWRKLMYYHPEMDIYTYSWGKSLFIHGKDRNRVYSENISIGSTEKLIVIKK